MANPQQETFDETNQPLDFLPEAVYFRLVSLFAKLQNIHQI